MKLLRKINNNAAVAQDNRGRETVSYTHLTLPTTERV